MTAITAEAPAVARRTHLAPVPDTANTTSSPSKRWAPLVIRLDVAADAVALRRLAYLDSARPIAGQVVLAEQDGHVVAAVSLADGRAIADPFVATSDIVLLLRLRAAQLNNGPAH